MTKISLTVARSALGAAKEEFARLLERPMFDISLYQPIGSDQQNPHIRDELYIIASGTGRFTCDTGSEDFRPGDVFFVAAGVQHRFETFSSDFSTWVIFFGPRPSSSAN